ncbi:hypothetical protein GPECTOR_1g229 [Gonium pectorale]|uniref:Ribosomal protein L19 n=1 Tax=Gonium pectorale TaxID=33097 RepID=A0A150H2P8_GONPE|nr:hypothetical protein GPECTOR_1g229 [Gonium pectorale]|eukprot:KXZ56262.1 hypothetical protein GPECTOR_1g229 [Gonium pectorale]
MFHGTPRAAADVPAGETTPSKTQLGPAAPATEDAGLDPLGEDTDQRPVQSSFSTSPSAVQLALPHHVLRDLRPPVQPYQIAPKLAQRPVATPALYTPWTPTRALQRRKHISKRMAFLVQTLEQEQVQRVDAARPLPDFKAGDILEVRMMVPEAERKVAIYRGVCIARYDKGIRTSFKIYNVFPDCGGVVQHIPLYMPDLLGLRVVGRIPAKQERLYYLLERQGSEYTFQTNVTAAT